MSTAPRSKKMTPDEYLQWEREQIERHEYYDGEVFCQSCGSRRHSLIGTNLLAELSHRLKGHPCEAHGSDMRVHVQASNYFAYPDVSVVCPPVEGISDDVISNPVLLAEVLSPSTADFCLGGKFGHYRRIPALQEYLVFWQDEFRVEQHTRTAEGLWLLRESSGLDAVLTLTAIDMSLALSDVYAKVVFET